MESLRWGYRVHEGACELCFAPTARAKDDENEFLPSPLHPIHEFRIYARKRQERRKRVIGVCDQGVVRVPLTMPRKTELVYEGLDAGGRAEGVPQGIVPRDFAGLRNLPCILGLVGLENVVDLFVAFIFGGVV